MLNKEEIQRLVNARAILLKEGYENYNCVVEAMKTYVETASKGNDKDTNEAWRLLNAHAQHYLLFVLDVLGHPIVFSSQELAWTNGRREYISCGVINHEVWEGPYGVRYRYVSVQGNDPRYWANFNQFDATTTLRLANVCKRAFDEEFKAGVQQEEEKQVAYNVESDKGINASFLREHLHNTGDCVLVSYYGPLPCPEITDVLTAHKSASSERPYYIDMIDDLEAEHGIQTGFATFADLVEWLNAHHFTLIEGEEETNQPNMEK